MIPAVMYAARSKTDEDRNESTASQVEQIRERLGDRVSGQPFVDYASGSKSNRGPGLAAAIEAATATAEEFGEAELWVFHSSRLARGTGKKGEARALGALLYQLREVGVTVRSVTDDEFTTNEQMWGFASSQSAQYSQDLSKHVKRGYVKAAERGTAAWLARGIRLGGYEVLKAFDASGRVVHTARKHPEDAWIYELIWEMALAGSSAQTIQLELSARGARTRPARKDHKFSALRRKPGQPDTRQPRLLPPVGPPGRGPREARRLACLRVDRGLLPTARGAPGPLSRDEAEAWPSSRRLPPHRASDLSDLRLTDAG